MFASRVITKIARIFIHFIYIYTSSNFIYIHNSHTQSLPFSNRTLPADAVDLNSSNFDSSSIWKLDYFLEKQILFLENLLFIYTYFTYIHLYLYIYIFFPMYRYTYRFIYIYIYLFTYTNQFIYFRFPSADWFDSFTIISLCMESCVGNSCFIVNRKTLHWHVRWSFTLHAGTQPESLSTNM